MKAVSHTSRQNYSSSSNLSTANINNGSDTVIELSQTATVYKSTKGRIYILAYVNNTASNRKLVKLTSLNGVAEDTDEDENEKENENPGNDYRSTHEHPTNPTFVFTLISQLYTVYTDYCGSPLKPLKVEQNYDILCNVTQDFLQSGYPFITDINILKENTPNRESLGSKIISTTSSIAKSYGANGAVGALGSNLSLNSLTNNNSSSVKGIASSKFKGTSSQSSDAVPWRKAGIKYTNNELFLDLTETLNVVLTPSHKSAAKKNKKLQINNTHKLFARYATIIGQMDFRSTLSGIPHVQLALNLNGHKLGLPALHHSVNKEKFANMEGSVLSFIPPDGNFRLMDYVLDIDSYPSSSLFKNLGIVDIEYQENLGLHHNEFEISLNLKMNTKVGSVQGLRIEIRLNPEQEDNLKVLRVSHGDFQIKSQGKYEWVFDDEVKLGINPVLRCAIETEGEGEHEPKKTKTKLEGKNNSTVVFPMEISLNYSNKGALASGIKVDSLNIMKGFNDSSVKPFKGVKYGTKTGDFVIR